MYTISSTEKLPVGKIVDSPSLQMCLTDKDGVEHENVRFFVLREITRKEHIDCQIHQVKSVLDFLVTVGQREFFYEISID